jgi:predicted nuclease of predicted toxin-antitoxin system
MRLLIDMNLTPRWVQYLREAGHDCTHWSEVGMTTAPGAAICAYGREHGYVVITNDLDFPQILAHTSEAKPSIILLRGEPLTPELRGPVLLSAILECREELEAGAILTIDWSDKVRARLLPLRI